MVMIVSMPIHMCKVERRREMTYRVGSSPFGPPISPVLGFRSPSKASETGAGASGCLFPAAPSRASFFAFSLRRVWNSAWSFALPRGRGPGRPRLSSEGAGGNGARGPEGGFGRDERVLFWVQVDANALRHALNLYVIFLDQKSSIIYMHTYQYIFTYRYIFQHYLQSH